MINKKVIVFHEYERIRTLISLVLKNIGVGQVVSTGERETLRKMCESLEPNLVVLNHSGFDGFDTVDAIRASKCKSQPLTFMLTVPFYQKSETLAKQMGVDYVYSDPFDIWRVRDAIVAILKE